MDRVQCACREMEKIMEKVEERIVEKKEKFINSIAINAENI